MTRAGVQLYTLRDVDLSFEDRLRRVADAGFEGIEFAHRVAEADPDAVAATLEATGLGVAGAHVGIDDLEEDFEARVSFYRALGCEDLVVPYLPAEHFASREAVAAAADRLDDLGARLADRGLALHYHNHDHEFADLGDETRFDAFVEATDVGIELDLGLAMAAGDDVVARLRALGDRARLVHCKDYDLAAGESVPLGRGDLDLDRVSAAVREIESDWLLYEYEGADPLDSLDEAAATVREHC